MSKKYKFILEIPDDMEVDSEYDVDGCVIWPTYSQAEPIKLKGLFDSYEEAKEAAEQFKVYNAILYINGTIIITRFLVFASPITT